MTGRITNQANQYGKDVEAYQVVAYLIQCLGNMFFYRLSLISIWAAISLFRRFFSRLSL